MSRIIRPFTRPNRRPVVSHTDRSVWRTVPVTVETDILPVPVCVARLLP